MNTRAIFRGKRKDTSELIEGYLIESATCSYIVTLVDDKGCFKNSPRLLYCEVFPDSVSQFTGLTDKYGTKAFEGNILGGIYTDTFIKWCNKCKQFELFAVDEPNHCHACSKDCEWWELVKDNGKFEIVGNTNS